jgi:hypothetical protein
MSVRALAPDRPARIARRARVVGAAKRAAVGAAKRAAVGAERCVLGRLCQAQGQAEIAALLLPVTVVEGEEVRFALDSPLEGEGFEPSVPARETTLRDCLLIEEGRLRRTLHQKTVGSKGDPI